MKLAKKENQVNFLTWGDVDISTHGIVKISVDGQKAILEYEKNKFEVNKDIIKLKDPRLSNVWGNEIYRITLMSKKMEKNGSYTYIIKPAK